MSSLHDHCLTHRRRAVSAIRSLGAIFLTLFMAIVGSCSPEPEQNNTKNTASGMLAPHKANIEKVVRTERSTDTRYAIKTESCEIEWTVHKTDINKGVVQHRAYCSLSLPEQIPLLSRILRDILRTEETAKDFTTLFWGRLAPDTHDSVIDMSFRLAVAAARSPRWDAVNGKPIQGNENTVVVQITNEAMIYPELKAMFAQFGKHITCSAAEKVLVREARSLPFFPALQKDGIRPTDRLPFDCQTWFSVSDI